MDVGFFFMRIKKRERAHHNSVAMDPPFLHLTSYILHLTYQYRTFTPFWI